MGTFGVLRLDGGWECLTVERPWLGNTPSVSCIPDGVYELELGTYHRGGYAAYELVHVVGRSLIKIHRANLAAEVQGCIGVGLDEGWMAARPRPQNPNPKPRWGVTNSKATFDEFMRRMDGRKHDVLRIRHRRID